MSIHFDALRFFISDGESALHVAELEVKTEIIIALQAAGAH
jgi:hypothetical protein